MIIHLILNAQFSGVESSAIDRINSCICRTMSPTASIYVAHIKRAPLTHTQFLFLIFIWSEAYSDRKRPPKAYAFVYYLDLCTDNLRGCSGHAIKKIASFGWLFGLRRIVHVTHRLTHKSSALIVIQQTINGQAERRTVTKLSIYCAPQFRSVPNESSHFGLYCTREDIGPIKSSMVEAPSR